MVGEKLDIIEESIRKVAQILNAKIEKELVWSWNPFCEKYRYFDQFNREYKGHFSKRKNGVIVKVIPSRIEKKLNLKEEKREFILRNGKIYRKTDREIILKFLKNFFSKRNYNIEISIMRKTIGLKHNWTKAIIKENSHIGNIEIIRSLPHWEITLKDKDSKKPFFCTASHQYIFRLSPEFEIDKDLDEILIDYQESEIATTSLSTI